MGNTGETITYAKVSLNQTQIQKCTTNKQTKSVVFPAGAVRTISFYFRSVGGYLNEKFFVRKCSRFKIRRGGFLPVLFLVCSIETCIYGGGDTNDFQEISYEKNVNNNIVVASFFSLVENRDISSLCRRSSFSFSNPPTTKNAPTLLPVRRR